LNEIAATSNVKRKMSAADQLFEGKRKANINDEPSADDVDALFGGRRKAGPDVTPKSRFANNDNDNDDNNNNNLDSDSDSESNAMNIGMSLNFY
jgi:hypothetical protein